jgi:hypothetical protein
LEQGMRVEDFVHAIRDPLRENAMCRQNDIVGLGKGGYLQTRMPEVSPALYTAFGAPFFNQH